MELAAEVAAPLPTQVAGSRLPLRIMAARVGGVEIPNQKRIEYSLQYVFGIGHTTAKSILSETVCCGPWQHASQACSAQQQSPYMAM